MGADRSELQRLQALLRKALTALDREDQTRWSSHVHWHKDQCVLGSSRLAEAYQTLEASACRLRECGRELSCIRGVPKARSLHRPVWSFACFLICRNQRYIVC